MLTGLRQRGDLVQALSPEGVRIPIQKSFLETNGEYKAVDTLLHFVNAHLCDEDSSTPNCYLLLKLKIGSDRGFYLDTVRIVDPDGRRVPIPGKIQ